MIPPDSLQAISSLLLSERISYKGSEIMALNKVINDINAEINQQSILARVQPVAPIQAVEAQAPEPARPKNQLKAAG